MLTFEVQIYGLRDLGRGRKPHQLRWRVGQKPHSKTFATNALADGRRSELMTAQRKGEPFDVDTGLPASELRKLNQVTWFAHAKQYAEAKWPRSSAKNRATRADALATITEVLVTDRRGQPDRRVLRRALSCWAFNFSEHQPEPPEEITTALAWITTKSIELGRLEDSETVRIALDAIARLLNGKVAAENTINRKRMVFNNALRYAVERRRLPGNPLQFIDWTPPETDDEIDFRWVPSPQQGQALLEAAAKVSDRGRHLKAFYGCILYAATRPAEGTNLRLADCALPETGWGQLVLGSSSPRVGSRWTDDGQSHEERSLKRRARKATREVPIPPVLVQLLREHVAEFGTAPDGRLFRATEGGRLLTKETAAVWKEARKLALAPEEVTTALASVPYSCRHTAVSGWLAAGVDQTEVARRAGHSVAVLLRFYAKIINGRQERANTLIERFLDGEEPPV
ncbi:tyrosine-type recombinase/integrase [Kitasatospora sp. NPDC052896]|uniref:tyrosine-type recombinase/integrase n=1 Tax=Kitasatospora sp. NPDC052896 TaxID=3364061 RepID=UPI0037C86799